MKNRSLLVLIIMASLGLGACGPVEVGVENTKEGNTPPASLPTANIPSRTPVDALATPTLLGVTFPTATPVQILPPVTNTPPAPTQAPPTNAPQKAASPTSPRPTAAKNEVLIYLIALEDNGKSGPLVGCGDSAVPVSVSIQPTPGVLKAAFQILLANKNRNYGGSGLYNALYQSNLKLESAKIENGIATLQLSGSLTLGGECDNPRVKAQLEQTALQFTTVQSVAIFINNRPLDDVLSLK